MSKIKSFRGQIENGGIETIPLSTNNGSVGYRIVKFQVIPSEDADSEQSIKIYSIPQTTATNDINFEDNTLLAACFFSMSVAAHTGPEDITIVFDNMVFNQDIYVTNMAHNAAQTMNYYIELEQMKLDLNENTIATLKDIRNIEAQ